jgi:hypothetical protein
VTPAVAAKAPIPTAAPCAFADNHSASSSPLGIASTLAA